ncbi:polyprenyl synthetase family protein [Erysipelothrix urinaevulpis]|uniref:polyprenyl synthetase family protein n=1 Tax=Erysipelothrix urinaevulpis TaxID=2683717 RepID=UPI001359A824|nr:polyprenyl synthetase family protein [Erysipelothrix urinaevulpis]
MKDLINNNLQETMDLIPNSIVKEAMAYSLLGDGKRLRSQLLLSLLKDFEVDVTKGLPFASSLEMIHTYSLVHDDLPAMDDDDYRRHRLTNHKVYGEGMAILAGDALLTYSFQNCLQSSLSDGIVLTCIEILSRNAGIYGMILGQELDIDNQMKTLDDLIVSYEHKTGKLFAAAFEMAVVIAGKKDKQELASTLGHKLGVLFQVQDDLLEYTKSFEEIGKDVKSDVLEEKVTVVTLLGLDEAINYKEKLVQSFYDDLELLGGTGNTVKNLIDEIVKRNY